MKIYLVRHAQCLSNRGLKIDKHNYLTDIGKEQARRLGTYFKKVKIDKIFCSTSTRTKETLKYILPYLNVKNIVYTDQIKEHYRGIYSRNKDGKKYYNAIKNSKKGPYEFRPKNGESYMDLLGRAKKFWDSVKKTNAKNILIVSHNGFSRCFIINLLKLDISEEKYFIISNASVSTFNINKKGDVKNFHVNDYNHLLKEGIKIK